MGKFKFDGVEYEIPEKFTVGELRKMEQKVGGFTEGAGLGTTLAVLWIARRRVDKTARFEDFDELAPEELDALMEAVEEEEPEADASPPELTAVEEVA